MNLYVKISLKWMHDNNISMIRRQVMLSSCVRDGKLGADTRMAVGLFQEMRGLKMDYVVGVKTAAELLRA